MTMDVVEEIKVLQRKKEKAQNALAKYNAQLETFKERLTELETELQEKYGITPDESEEYLAKLREEQAQMLEDAREVLGKINL
jgi:DNA repair ATPase RecN